jgi:hypothetical protein
MTSMLPTPRSSPRATIAAANDDSPLRRRTRRPCTEERTARLVEMDVRPRAVPPAAFTARWAETHRLAASTEPGEPGSVAAAKPRDPRWPENRRSDTPFIMGLTVLPKETRPVANPTRPKPAGSRRVTPDTLQAAKPTQPTPTRSAHAPARHERTAEGVDRCDATRLLCAKSTQPTSGSHPG